MVRIILAALIGAAGSVSIFKIVEALSIKKEQEADRFTILQKFRSYDENEDTEWTFGRMVLYRPVTEMLRKYRYDDYCENVDKNSDDIAFAVLDFVCDRFWHDGNAKLPKKRSLSDMVESCEKSEMKTNCRGLSLILAELLRMNGVKARHVTCMPYEDPFDDCHVVVDCELPSGKRVMLDPTYRLYLKDGNGNFVSLEHLREGILKKETFTPNENASYNGTAFSYENYMEYMTKNCFRFATNLTMADAEPSAGEIELIPKDYKPRKTIGTRYTKNPAAFWNMKYKAEKDD